MARREPEKYSLDPEEVKEYGGLDTWVLGRRRLVFAFL